MGILKRICPFWRDFWILNFERWLELNWKQTQAILVLSIYCTVYQRTKVEMGLTYCRENVAKLKKFALYFVTFLRQCKLNVFYQFNITNIPSPPPLPPPPTVVHNWNIYSIYIQYICIFYPTKANKLSYWQIKVRLHKLKSKQCITNILDTTFNT